MVVGLSVHKEPGDAQYSPHIHLPLYKYPYEPTSSALLNHQQTPTPYHSHNPQDLACQPAMELYMDEKWKLSKKGSRNNGSRRAAIPSDSHTGRVMKKSASAREAVRPPRSFSSRCAGLVKEQRAKFYIMRRCVTMLICWRDYP